MDITTLILVAFFLRTPAFFAYAQQSRRFLFLIESIDKVRFLRITGYVILPVHKQIAAAIGGFYFGGGLASN